MTRKSKAKNVVTSQKRSQGRLPKEEQLLLDYERAMQTVDRKLVNDLSMIWDTILDIGLARNVDGVTIGSQLKALSMLIDRANNAYDERIPDLDEGDCDEDDDDSYFKNLGDDFRVK